MTNTETTTLPTQEERLLACVAHLALFGGFWLIGPLVIYFWKGKESRFLAFHSAQAILLALLMFLFGSVLVVAVIVMAILGGVVLGQMGTAAGLAVVIAGYALAGVVALLPTILAIIGGFKAFKGEWWGMPIIGRLTRRWLEAASPQASAG